MRNSERRAIALDSLIEASLSTLQDVGYNRMRTADVAKRSQLSEGTLFRYFPTKYDLTQASLEQALQNHVQRMTERFVALELPIERRALFEMLWELISHPEMGWTYELFAAANTDAKLRAQIAPILNAHTEEVDDIAVAVVSDAFGMSAHEAISAINLSTWAMQGLVLRDMGRGPTGSQAGFIDYLVFLAEASYRSAPAAGAVR